MKRLIEFAATWPLRTAEVAENVARNSALLEKLAADLGWDRVGVDAQGRHRSLKTGRFVAAPEPCEC